MITVAPLVLIFFFVYAQLPDKEENIPTGRRFPASMPLWPISERLRLQRFSTFSFSPNG